MRHNSLQDWLLYFPKINHTENALSADDQILNSEIELMVKNARENVLIMSLQNAIAQLMQAWDLNIKLKNKYNTVEISFLLSLIVPQKMQNSWRQTAIKNCKEFLTDPTLQSWYSYIMQLEGWHAFDFKKYPESLDCFEQSLQNTKDAAENIQIRWAQARIYRAQNKIQEALDLQLKNLEEIKSLNISNGYISLEIAECYQYFHKKQEAKLHFEQAFLELSKDKWFYDNRKDDLDRMEEIYKKKY
jgi:tetratricopeptide (TPR) repeat protein